MAAARVVFAGATGFSIRCLESVAELDDVEVVGVVTAPESFKISYRPTGVRNVLYADVGRFARDRGLSVHLQTGSMNEPAVLDAVQRWHPDLILVIGWYHMVPAAIRALAP